MLCFNQDASDQLVPCRERDLPGLSVQEPLLASKRNTHPIDRGRQLRLERGTNGVIHPSFIRLQTRDAAGRASVRGQGTFERRSIGDGLGRRPIRHPAEEMGVPPSRHGLQSLGVVLADVDGGPYTALRKRGDGFPMLFHLTDAVFCGLDAFVVIPPQPEEIGS